MYDTLNDNELLSLLKNDEEAFTEIYNRYWERLYFMAHKRLQSAADVKEIIQDVFLSLWQKRFTLQIESLPLYLAAMTRYAVYRHLAGEKRRKFHLQVVHRHEAERVGAAFDLDNKQFLEILTKLSNAMPEKYKLVFICHKLLDRPLEEVAQQLGVSPRTAERYVTEVMKIMRNHREKLVFSTVLLLVN